jgi:hypothetical protein
MTLDNWLAKPGSSRIKPAPKISSAVMRTPLVQLLLEAEADIESFDPLLENRRVDQLLTQEYSGKFSVLGTVGHELAGRKVVSLHTPPRPASGPYGITNGAGASLPTRGKFGGLHRYTVYVEAVRTMKLR